MEESSSTPAPVSSHGLPDIGDLFSESWHYFKKSFLHILLFNLIGWAAMFGLVIAFVMVLIFSGVGIGSLFQSGTVPNFAVLAPVITIAVIFGLFFFFLIMLASTFTQVGTILSLVHAQDKTGFGQLFSLSFKFLFPVLVISLIVSFIIGGGLLFFIIPYFLFTFFFMFALFVYITEKTSLLDSLRRSMGIVLSHFWGLLGRVLLVVIVYVIIVILMAIVFKDSTAGSFASWIIQTIIGWFLFAYMFVLFIHAQKSTDSKRMSSLLWPTIIAIIGYILGVLLIIGMIAAFAQLSKSGALDEIKKEFASEMSSEKTVKTASGPAAIFIKSGNAKIDEAITISQKPNVTQADREQITSLLQEGIIDLKKATETDPDSYEAWMALGLAYRTLSAVSPDAGQFVVSSYNKAIEIDPKNPDAFIALGGYYYQKQQYSTAITYFQKATEVAPNNANAWYNLAATYRIQGNKTQAKAAYQKTLQLLPNNSPDRQMVQEELNDL